MYFSPMAKLLEHAEEKAIAYGGYVITSYETAMCAISAGNKTGTPIILICAPECCDLMGGIEHTASIVKVAAKHATVPVALHLDHCTTYEECVEAIKAGFSSVMIDGSSLPLEENIALTKKVVDYAHAYGVTVEGELGKLVGEEGSVIVKGPEAAQTDPAEAATFVKETGVDCLAVSIGTQHGAYTCVPTLNIERLSKIREAVNKLPLVLHGGSGTPKEQVAEAIKNGIRKINVGTDLFISEVDCYADLRAEEGFKYNLTPYIEVQKSIEATVVSKINEFRFEN